MMERDALERGRGRAPFPSFISLENKRTYYDERGSWQRLGIQQVFAKRMMMATLPFLHFCLEEKNDGGHHHSHLPPSSNAYLSLPSFISRKRE